MRKFKRFLTIDAKLMKEGQYFGRKGILLNQIEILAGIAGATFGRVAFHLLITTFSGGFIASKCPRTELECAQCHRDVYFVRPALSDTERDSAPEVLDGVGKVASGAVKAVGGLL